MSAIVESCDELNRGEERTFRDEDGSDDSTASSLHQRKPYISVNTAEVSVHGAIDWQQQEARKCSWIKALSVLSIALTINFAILTVYIFVYSEPIGTAAKNEWAPLPEPHQVLTRLSFGSCNAQNMPQAHLDTLVAHRPDVVVLMGDNVYGDCKNASCITLSQAYKDWAMHPSFIGAKSRLPMVATLDDHDYGQGDCHVNNPYKETAKTMFLDFFDIQDERRNRRDDGVYYSYKWGADDRVVQVILLDTRYHRSAFLKTDEPGATGKEAYVPLTNDTSAQMLSPNQWKWLEDQMKERAHVRIIVSSIQVLSHAHGFECWRMLPHELKRLQKLILEQKSTSTTLLVSGDRHVGGIYETADGLVEMTASSWTHTMPFGTYNQTSDEVDEIRIGGLVRDNHFGSIEIDWETRNLTLSLRKANGSPAYRYHNHSAGQKTDAGSMLKSRSYTIPI